jgi:hypothetical protein
LPHDFSRKLATMGIGCSENEMKHERGDEGWKEEKEEEK